ncbi:hypothetical protein NBCG_01579 [Nocardioidaceae bacterium Broad-1]|nr:hypothetical protein NBCG_01579 [Nocardioidaceae bacterium Broad-1]
MSRLVLLYCFVLARLDTEGRRTRDERGSVTVEHVLWAVAVIAIVAIVVAAIRAFVTAQSGSIR